MSFGGAAGTEVAAKCSSAASLKAAYKTVIDRYNLTRVDFDIEGAARETMPQTCAEARRSPPCRRTQLRQVRRLRSLSRCRFCRPG